MNLQVGFAGSIGSAGNLVGCRVRRTVPMEAAETALLKKTCKIQVHKKIYEGGIKLKQGAPKR